jgi:hypothetical protein
MKKFGERPVEYFLESTFFSLNQQTSMVSTIYFKKTKLTLRDNIFGLFSNIFDDYFYSISKTEMFASDANNGPGPGMYLF